MTDPEELVVLLDEDGTPIGTAPKATVHAADTPLHLAFSCYVTDADGRLLVTRRALSKRAFPGVWTNSFCGHPAPGEDMAEAVARRALDELGIVLTDLQVVLPDFRYRATDATGIVENEICPVYRARTDEDVEPDPDEAVEFRWVDAEDLRTAASMAPWAFSPWLNLQLAELAAGS